MSTAPWACKRAGICPLACSVAVRWPFQYALFNICSPSKALTARQLQSAVPVICTVGLWTCKLTILTFCITLHLILIHHVVQWTPHFWTSHCIPIFHSAPCLHHVTSEFHGDHHMIFILFPHHHCVYTTYVRTPKYAGWGCIPNFMFSKNLSRLLHEHRYCSDFVWTQYLTSKFPVWPYIEECPKALLPCPQAPISDWEPAARLYDLKLTDNPLWEAVDFGPIWKTLHSAWVECGLGRSEDRFLTSFKQPESLGDTLNKLNGGILEALQTN